MILLLKVDTQFQLKESVWERKDDDPILHWYNYHIPKERILDWFPEGLKIVES